MNLAEVLQQLRAERDRIEQAVHALEALENGIALNSPPAETPKKRRISAAGRRRIIAATKARWARIRAAQGTTTSVAAQAKTAKPPAIKRRMSAAARKRISQAAKARWAAAKAKGRSRL